MCVAHEQKQEFMKVKDISVAFSIMFEKAKEGRYCVCKTDTDTDTDELNRSRVYFLFSHYRD